MKIYRNLHLIGTSHIAQQSVQEVEEAILKYRPKIVALELDQRRFMVLMQKAKGRVRLGEIRKIGLKGFLFHVLGFWVEKKLGNMVGVPPGSEMRKAAETAIKVKADIALIDEDVERVLKRLSRRITWREKGRFIKEAFLSFFSTKQKVRIDLTKVPEEKLIRKMTAKVKKSYPSFYKTIIEERNEYMARNLYKLMNLEKEGIIIAVIGAGHEKELIALIKNENNFHKKRDPESVDIRGSARGGVGI